MMNNGAGRGLSFVIISVRVKVFSIAIYTIPPQTNNNIYLYVSDVKLYVFGTLKRVFELYKIYFYIIKLNLKDGYMISNWESLV